MQLQLLGLYSALALAFGNIGRAASDGKFYYTDNGSTITIDGPTWASRSGAIVIPETIGGKPVTEIADAAFYRQSALTSVSIPNSVTSIGDEAFYGCQGIESQTLPSGLTSLGSAAFYTCLNLKSINLPAGITEIGDSTFGGCFLLSSITLPDGLTRIGSSAFGGCASLPSIKIPPSVTSIGDYAFNNCKGFTTLTLPPLITSIPEGTFLNAIRLKTITIDSNVQSIGKMAFKGSMLENLTLPASITELGEEAFGDCIALRKITIRGPVKTLPDQLFKGCIRLQEVKLPKTVRNVGASAFLNIPILKIELPAVRTIGDSAFANCNGLLTVQFPKSLRTIGASAFAGCRSLASARFEGNAPTLGSKAFQGNARGFKFFIEDTSKGFTIPRWKGRPISLPAAEIMVRTGGDQINSGEFLEKFGSQIVGTRGLPRTYHVWNVGNRQLTGIHAGLSNRLQSHYALLRKPKQVLAPGTCTSVRLASKPLSNGRHRDVLSVVSSDPDESPFTIDLSGFGVELVE